MTNGSESIAQPILLVSFRTAGRLHPYTVEGNLTEIGTSVVVQTDRGISVGSVSGHSDTSTYYTDEPIQPIIRIASQEDLTQEDRNRERELRGTLVCLQYMRQHRLNMKLVKVHYMLGGQKAVFYFTADGRVDFRALVKDLARDLRIRVEMRQIGVRDETKILGGVGHCGLELCCSTWLRDFVPVSIRMAKDQNLALNPQKVSGACGRLLCCLAYEHETYVDMRQELPKVGRRLHTTAGPGRVTAIEVLKQRFVIELDEGGRTLLSTEDILSHDAPPYGRDNRGKKPQLATLKPKDSDPSSKRVESAPASTPEPPKESSTEAKSTVSTSVEGARASMVEDPPQKTTQAPQIPPEESPSPEASEKQAKLAQDRAPGTSDTASDSPEAPEESRDKSSEKASPSSKDEELP